MNTQNTNTKEQNHFIAELCAEYGIEPDQIVFFENDPEPIFDREATAILLHRLTDVSGIEDDFVEAASHDSVAAKYKVTFKDGTFAASTGVATSPTSTQSFGPGAGSATSPTMTLEQLRSLAIGRAARSALRNKGINLLKLHNQRKAGNVSSANFSGPALTERQRLLREVHALGYETGLIYESATGNDRTVDKSGWYRVLDIRYKAKASDDLLDDQLKDFASFLRTQLPQQQSAA